MIKNVFCATVAMLLPLTNLFAAPPLGATHAATSHFKTLYHFSKSQNGEREVESQLVALNGVLYGTAVAGGSLGKGTLFKLDLDNLAETTVYSFLGGKRDGEFPSGPLSLVGDSIYGSTIEGHGTEPGSNGNYMGFGTIWKLNAHLGKTRVFHGFNGTDGSQPFSGVTPVNGVLYGVTWYGGPNNSGTMFALDGSGKLTQLYAFPDSNIGCNPLDSVTVVGRMLYGTTTFCGAGSTGTVYAFNLDSGRASLLHSFAPNPNGSAEPNALVYENGALYGTTFDDGGAGNAYKIDLKTGQYSVLHQFSGGADGGVPSSAMTAFQGKLYGVTEQGGANDEGTVYSIDPATGDEAVVYSFTGGTDGDTPFAGLLANGGALYGSTLNLISEYPNSSGSLFKLIP